MGGKKPGAREIPRGKSHEKNTGKTGILINGAGEGNNRTDKETGDNEAPGKAGRGESGVLDVGGQRTQQRDENGKKPQHLLAEFSVKFGL